MIYHDAHDILPDEECLLCAEKHYSYAMELANEIGYIQINNQKIIGQLTAAQWHIYKFDEQLANSIRDIRHFVQERNTDKIDWKPICVKLDEMIKKDKEESLAKYSNAESWAFSLIGKKDIPQSKIKRLIDLHSGFMKEKDIGGGCSSCRLRRLIRSYKETLRFEFCQ